MSAKVSSLTLNQKEGFKDRSIEPGLDERVTEESSGFTQRPRLDVRQAPQIIDSQRIRLGAYNKQLDDKAMTVATGQDELL